MFVLLLFNLRTCSALVLIVPPENLFRVIEERKTNESVCLVWKHDVREKKSSNFAHVHEKIGRNYRNRTTSVYLSVSTSGEMASFYTRCRQNLPNITKPDVHSLVRVVNRTI